MDTAAADPNNVATGGGEPLAELASAMFWPLGADGVYGRTALFERIVDGLSLLISSHREPETEPLRLPPVMSRSQLETSGYLKSFPNLLGCVCTLHGTEAEIRAAADRSEIGGEWTAALAPADLVLTPAACYPIYPLAARRGPVPQRGLRFDVASDCFRREPSQELARLQSFRMREYVGIGAPDEVVDFRDRWIDRGRQLAEELGLTCRIAPASDPFFGRMGQMMAVSQLQRSLKFELMVALRPPEQPVACMSFNSHLDHFASIWGLQGEAGQVVHSACVAFGIDRLAIALFCQHGIDLQKWPFTVRRALSL
jgi:seryl-tRNA synthetase